MAWNVFKIDSSKIGFYQNFLIYCDKFDNKIIYCLARFRAGNFSPAPTSTGDEGEDGRKLVQEQPGGC